MQLRCFTSTSLFSSLSPQIAAVGIRAFIKDWHGLIGGSDLYLLVIRFHIVTLRTLGWEATRWFKKQSGYRVAYMFTFSTLQVIKRHSTAQNIIHLFRLHHYFLWILRKMQIQISGWWFCGSRLTSSIMRCAYEHVWQANCKRPLSLPSTRSMLQQFGHMSILYFFMSLCQLMYQIFIYHYQRSPQENLFELNDVTVTS